jgi:hypothetical protein
MHGRTTGALRSIVARAAGVTSRECTAQYKRHRPIRCYAGDPECHCASSSLIDLQCIVQDY